MSAPFNVQTEPVSTKRQPEGEHTRATRKLFGLVSRRERWGLSWAGRLFVVASALIVLFVVLFCAHPYLAVTHRVPNADYLVVEGWVHDFGVQAAVQEFKTGNYQRVFTTGGPIEGQGGYINDYHTVASLGAELLKQAGIPAGALQMVPSHVIGRDRTYSSAIALRDWFRENHIPVSTLNVLTEDGHARRTWLLFQKAFGKQVEIGIISATNPDYDAKRWWRSSEGVREVIGESIALVYAKFFFWPKTGQS